MPKIVGKCWYRGRTGRVYSRMQERGLPKCSQPDFGNFMNALYSLNKYEFDYLLNQGLLEDSPFKCKLLELIKKDQVN